MEYNNSYANYFNKIGLYTDPCVILDVHCLFPRKCCIDSLICITVYACHCLSDQDKIYEDSYSIFFTHVYNSY